MYALEGKKSEKDDDFAFSITSKNGASIRTAQWRYTRWGEGPLVANEELYDHKNDPEEHYNLADNPKYKKQLNELRKMLDEARKRARKKI